MLTSMNGEDGLARLRAEFPSWRFGTAWTTAASGPDRCRWWARNEDAFLSAWSAAGLRAAVSAEQWRCGDTPGA
jgi:hypothetical protein